VYVTVVAQCIMGVEVLIPIRHKGRQQFFFSFFLYSQVTSQAVLLAI